MTINISHDCATRFHVARNMTTAPWDVDTPRADRSPCAARRLLALRRALRQVLDELGVGASSR